MQSESFFAKKPAPFSQRFFSFAEAPHALAVLLITSFVLKLIYLFCWSGYADHILTDMYGYWWRAHALYGGNAFSPQMWMIWPILPHLLIYNFFRALASLGLFEQRHEATLILFAFLSTFTAGWTYGITRELSKNRRLAFWSAFFFAFSYPVLYFNGLIMSENFAIPFLALATFLVLPDDSRHYFWAGAALGLTAGVRPNLGVLVLPFTAYVLGSKGISKKSLGSTAVFLSGFALLIFFIFAQNYYFSGGKLKEFSPNGGYSFFIQQCKPHSVIANNVYGPDLITHPAFVDHPELGDYKTDHGWIDQKFFYSKGIECIRNNPSTLLDNFKLLSLLFWGPIWPVFLDSKGLSFWMPVFNHLHFWMTASLLPLFFALKKNQPVFSKFLLLLSIPVINTAVLFIFGVDQRYFFPCLFAVYALSIGFLPVLWTARKKVLAWFGIILCLFAARHVGDAVRSRQWQKLYGFSSIREFAIERLPDPAPNGTAWNTWGNVIFLPVGKPVLLKSRRMIRASTLQISADCNDTYLLTFYRNDERLGDLVVPLAIGAPPTCGLWTRRIEMTPSLKGKEFNRILARPEEHDGLCSIGSMQFDGSAAGMAR